MTAKIISQGHEKVEQKIADGLDFILSHLKEPIWPRTISTKTTEGRQIPIYSKQEALAWYKAANFLDCRISAYPYYGKHVVDPTYMIDFLMIDLDLSNFRSGQIFERARSKTFLKIKEIFGADFIPSELWSGNGYHIYIPTESRYILEKRPEFSRFEKPSRQFLRFTEWYLSKGKSDSNHYKNVSFGNCMLRIPSSHNSKCVERNSGVADSSSQIRIINAWNRKRAPIYWLIGSFLAYLVDQKYKEERELARYSDNRHTYNSNKISWIEIGILRHPLSDHRKYIIWRILSPYLLNVKNLAKEESCYVIQDWLDKCDKLERLTFNAKSKTIEGLRGASKGYYPISLVTLKSENEELYDVVVNRLE
jgi:Primase X